jgi:hypothetical protein
MQTRFKKLTFQYRSNISIQLLDQWELTIWHKPYHNNHFEIRTSAVCSITILPLLCYCVQPQISCVNPNLKYVYWRIKYTLFIFWTHAISLVIDKIAYATIVKHRLTIRENLTRYQTARVLQTLHKLLFGHFISNEIKQNG